MKRLMIITLIASGAWATDFSQLNTEEMMNMRGSVPIADRPAFQEEMQKRMQSMTPQERQKYKSMRGKGQGVGQGGGMGMRQNCMKNQPTFAEYDLNNDGKITKSELEEARTKRMNQKAQEGKMLRNAGNAPSFTSMDKNNDGILNQEEFRLHQTEQMKKCSTTNCATGDCPSPGKSQGKGMMRNAGNAPTFADIDTDGDGMISKEEFSVHQSQRIRQ